MVNVKVSHIDIRHLRKKKTKSSNYETKGPTFSMDVLLCSMC